MFDSSTLVGFEAKSLQAQILPQEKASCKIPPEENPSQQNASTFKCLPAKHLQAQCHPAKYLQFRKSLHCNKISPKSRSSLELTTSICLYLRKHLLDSRTDLEDPFPDLASQWLEVVSYDLVAYTQIQNGNHFLASRSCLV